MLSARLIRSLLKRLSQVLVVFTRVATSSTQKLRILLSCLRHFATKLQRDSIESRVSESASEPCTATLTSVSGGWCSQSTTPLLPSHNAQVTAPNSIQSAAPASPLQCLTTTPPLHQATPPPSSPVEVSIPNGSSFRVDFRTLPASNNLRYDHRCFVYVVAAFHHKTM